MPDIPTYRAPDSALTRLEFDSAVAKMPNFKAVGPDGIPAEVIKYCPSVKTVLFEIVQKMWEEEELPAGFAQARFVMLYKKDSANDPGNYRCIALLNHAYKILSRIILMRLIGKREAHLQDWQAGFRPHRGCRDNTMVLRTLCQRMMSLGQSIAITFIDYASAFDTVSHKFLDEALVKAGASNKTRAMFRAVYRSASAFTAVADADGKSVKSDVFAIRRGVVQGDITSPLYFILALDLILRRYDDVAGKGVAFGDILLHTLGYADDVALIDYGHPAGIEMASNRVTAIAAGSKKDADMTIKIKKTKVLHVRTQDPITATTEAEALNVCKFTCPHWGCDFKFRTKRGLRVHEGRCEWKDECELEQILDFTGPVCARQYLIRWKGFASEHDSWIPRGNLHPESIRDFEKINSCYVEDWPHRCNICDLPCRTQRGVAIHRSRMHKDEKPQNFAGTLADRAVQVGKWTAQQTHRPTITCEDKNLENVFKFKYLGSLFAADVKQCYDIQARVAKAMSRCGQLRQLFDSPYLNQNIKLRLYKASVCSLLTYGCESWSLTNKVMRTLNGANSQMLSRVTGKSVQQEARADTTSYDLLKHIRRMRLNWLGQILRSNSDSIVAQSVKVQMEMNSPGNIRMNFSHP